MTQYHNCTGGFVRAVSVPGIIIMTMSDVNSDTDNMPTEILTLYVRSGFDGKKYGACPACQRVFMVLMLKAADPRSNIQFLVATVSPGRPPLEFKTHGLRNLPAVIYKNDALDTVEEIIEYIDNKVPYPNISFDSNIAESVVRDFFSKFCYFIKSVSRDSHALEQSLSRLDQFLYHLPTSFLNGNSLSHLDCEILPKLHHLRVASAVLKGYHIPASLTCVWRYLHQGYNTLVFSKSCPPDQEIVLHWADRPDTPSISIEDHNTLTREIPKFSFDIPAVAVPVKVDL